MRTPRRGSEKERNRGRRKKGEGDSQRKLFLPRVLRGKHGNPVTREEGSALFKEARDISRLFLPLSPSLTKDSSHFARAILARGRGTSLNSVSREHVRESRLASLI